MAKNTLFVKLISLVDALSEALYSGRARAIMTEGLLVGVTFWLLVVVIMYSRHYVIETFMEDKYVVYNSVEPASPTVKVGEVPVFISDRSIYRYTYRVTNRDRIFCSDNKESGFFPVAYIPESSREGWSPSDPNPVKWAFGRWEAPAMYEGYWCKGWHQYTVYPTQDTELLPVVLESGLFQIVADDSRKSCCFDASRKEGN